MKQASSKTNPKSKLPFVLLGSGAVLGLALVATLVGNALLGAPAATVEAHSGARDPASYVGINCGRAGDFSSRDGMENYFIKRNIASLNLAKSLDLGWARCGGGPEQWYVGGKPSPEKFDTVFNYANEQGVQVYLYIEYRGDLVKDSKITDYDWYEVGRAFAGHFGQKIGCYGLFNEVDHSDSPHPPADIARAVEAFADGVHSVDSTLLVSTPGMGGTPMDEKRADAYLKAIGPLVNAGKLQVMNLHSYHDSRPKKPHFSNIDNSSEWAPSHNFLRAKKVAGITVPVTYAAGEFNYRNWDGTDEDRGIGFMTTLWDQLMVVNSAGDETRNELFVMPYNIADDRAGRQTTMADKFEWKEDGSFEWVPNEKGRVLQQNLKATSGMEFLLSDPLDKGIAILRGNGKKAWVWHNRVEFSSLARQESVEITGIPADATTLTMMKQDSTVEKPYKVWPLQNQTTLKLKVTDLPPHQTFLFIANGENDAEVGAIR